MDDTTKEKLVKQLTKLFIKVIPDVTHRPMYGGTVFELKKDDPKSRLGGVFTYTNYVSLEFSKGAAFKDAKQVLEGSGKHRRHVKLFSLSEIKKKGCDDLIKQSLQLL